MSFVQKPAPLGFSGSVHIQVGAQDGLAEARWVQSVAGANPDWPMKQVVFCDLTSPDLNMQLQAPIAFWTIQNLLTAFEKWGREACVLICN